MSCCWLCKYNNTDEAKAYTTFVVENLGRMSIEQMARDLQEKIPDNTKEQIMLHFEAHSLHPSIRITQMLRNLLDLSRDMKASMVAVDPDSGHVSVDVKALDAYLKLQTQIISIYKVGEVRKLMFA